MRLDAPMELEEPKSVDQNESSINQWRSKTGHDALEAAVQVIKTRDDRPLFKLPLEIRKIVRPLLKNALAEHLT